MKPELSSLPLAFELNQGQAPAPYQFLARRGSTKTLFLTDGIDIFVPVSDSALARLRIHWAEVDPRASLSGEEFLLGHSNYLRGSDPSRWLRDIPQFAQLRCKHLYPGIDLFFHGSGDALEHDFVLQPGADPSRISLHLDKPFRITQAGDLIVNLGGAKVHLLRPVAYQESGASRKAVSAEFLVARNRDVRFKLGTYDHTMTLVIDPVFGFSTYLSPPLTARRK